MSSLIQSDKYNILINWWRERCQSFSLFYLFKTKEQRKDFILKCLPDIPLEAPATRERNGEIINSTDLIVPELFLEGLDAGDGRCLILFITRRLASPDTGLENDLNLLKSLYQKGVMPTFSNGSLDSLRLPFVDTLDPTETIQSLNNEVSKEIFDQANSHLASGRIIHAEVFLTCCIRRNLIATFLLALKENYEIETADLENQTITTTITESNTDTEIVEELSESIRTNSATEINIDSTNLDSSNMGIC